VRNPQAFMLDYVYSIWSAQRSVLIVVPAWYFGNLKVCAIIGNNRNTANPIVVCMLMGIDYL
jgi:hypothetical protein